MSNFIIYGLPRSRTCWLSHYLTYKDHKCHHEQAVTMRHPDDYKSFFKSNIGSAETGVAQGWWLIKKACPDIKEVVIHRPVNEVVESILSWNLPELIGYHEEKLIKHLNYSAQELQKISSRPEVLSIEFKDLIKMETCKKVFEHCLPYEFDIRHWSNLKNKNIQMNYKEHLEYYLAHKNEIDNFKKLCKIEMLKLYRNS